MKIIILKGYKPDNWLIEEVENTIKKMVEPVEAQVETYCCINGLNYEEQTGAHRNDHPGDCVQV